MNWYKKANIYDDLKKSGPWGESHPTPEQLEALQRNPADYHSSSSPMREWIRRDQFVQDYGWSVPSEEAVDKLVEFIGGDSVLEVGAGYGLWAKLLKEKGVSIVATDLQEAEKGSMYSPTNRNFFNVEPSSNIDAINKYQGFNVLMLVWPPYDSPMANEALKIFSGNKLIYIGEGMGGCTGDDCFHNQLAKGWKNVGYIDIPRWEGIGDSAMIFVRK